MPFKGQTPLGMGQPRDRAGVMRVLVTGASGLLGAELVRQLRSATVDLSAWSGSTPATLHGVPLQAMDLRQPTAVADAYRAARPEVILHAAALARAGDCFADPAR